MRKHRLAERLLADIIGLSWEDVHIEACRWEHVMSEAVERRIVGMLKKPLVCPHGNPIPGLEELGLPFATTDDPSALVTLTVASASGDATVTVDRISEQIQPDADLMRTLFGAGVRPGQSVSVSAADGGIEVVHGDTHTMLDTHVSDHVFVRVG
jgi:DtxR family Mn-dependent transcriptional regulator